MKLTLPISLLPYLLNFQILTEEKIVMVKEIEVQETKNVVLIPINQREVQKPTYIVMLQDIVSLPTQKNILRNLQMLREKLDSRKRSTQIV